MEPYLTLRSRVTLLPINNIDTDQIIPARFLKVIDRVGLGANLFADWRYLPDGSPDPAFILNQPDSAGTHILLVGDNFGCGSSREHAPWALAGFGFRVIISTSFADIFSNNALKNGLLPVVVTPEVHQRLVGWLQNSPMDELVVDLFARQITLPDGSSHSFPIDEFSHRCLLDGVDELGYLLAMNSQITAFETLVATS